MNVLTPEDVYPSRTGGPARIMRRRDPVVYAANARSLQGPLSAERLRRYEEKGYLLMPGLFSSSEVERLVREVESLAADPAMRSRPEIIIEPESGAIRSLFAVHRLSPLLGRLAAEPRILNVARQILASEVFLHQARINRKPGFEGREFYWHSDFETWHVEDGLARMRTLSCSILLTDNTATNGSLMVIPGSHREFAACPGTTPEDHFRDSLRRQRYGVPDHDTIRSMAGRFGIEMPTGPAGSVLFFDCNLMHGSNGNITPLPRTNIFYVYNSVHNRVREPFCGLKPRPEHIASRRIQEILSPDPGAFSGPEPACR